MIDSMPLSRPQSPEKVSWFEFLLDPSMLEKHLTSENTGPSPTELIISFLSNCSNLFPEQSSNGLKSNPPTPSPFGINNLPEECTIEDLEINVGEEKGESKKTQALKLLALKVTAFLKWDVSLLEKKLPLTMQQTLLTELLKITGINVKGNGFGLEAGLNPDAEFSRVLYYTWILRAVVEGSYPSKGQRGLNIQIPGQIDASVIPAATIDMIMKKLYEETERAAESLEEYLKQPSKVRMPCLKSFSPITDECLNPVHMWDQGMVLKEEEIICQISYGLGRFYFFQELYEKASKHFIKTSELFPKLLNPVFCQLNEMKLKGFYNACAHLLGYQKQDSLTPLREMLQSSAKSAHSETIQILRNDNVKRELPLALRDSVEMNILQRHLSKVELLLYVVFLNALRRTIDGKVILSDWCTLLKSNEEKSSLVICELLREIIPSCSTEQKMYLKNFVRMLCLISVPAKVLLKKFDVLTSMMTKKEVTELSTYGQHSKKKENVMLDESFTHDPSVLVGLLERKLLSSVDINTIGWILKELRLNFGARNLCALNRKWELPRPASIFLKSVPVQVDVELIQILLAKSNELSMIKQYKDSKPFFLAIEREIKNSSPRMIRYLKWELLRLDLYEILDSPVHECQPGMAEIVERIRDFLKSHKEREVPPDSNLLELCASILLNFREFDLILSLGPGYGCFFDLSAAICAVCHEVFMSKGNKTVSRELWDIVLPIFSNVSINPMKRTNSGMMKEPNSQAIMNKFAFFVFVKKIKDASCLGVIISCLSKFYNILKDDSIGEIFFEYAGLWPPSVATSSAFNMSAVSESFQATLHHALSVHPAHAAWLRTKGDVMYVQGHYAAALKYYISAAMVSSDYFYLQFPKVVFDDMMFKHMIHCCTKLHNHTQSAVIHQFLEESNYPVAFKALEDRLCNDSCDTYYPCIWDTTLLEFLISLHSRQGESDYRQLVMQIIGQLELNSNNNDEIQREAANVRKGLFFRSLSKQYL